MPLVHSSTSSMDILSPAYLIPVSFLIIKYQTLSLSDIPNIDLSMALYFCTAFLVSVEVFERYRRKGATFLLLFISLLV